MNFLSIFDHAQDVFTYSSTHMEKYICNIYVKIYEIYFRTKLYNYNIFCIYFLRYIRQNIFDIYYSKALEIYFHAKKLYMSYIYFIFIMVVSTRSCTLWIFCDFTFVTCLIKMCEYGEFWPKYFFLIFAECPSLCLTDLQSTKKPRFFSFFLIPMSRIICRSFYNID